MTLPNVPGALHDSLAVEHARLDAQLEQLVRTFDAENSSNVLAAWRSFDAGLHTQLATEEAHLIAAMPRAYDREARVLVQEHHYIRQRLADIGAAMAANVVRVEALRDLLDVLRAHTRSEARILRSRVEASVPEE